MADETGSKPQFVRVNLLIGTAITMVVVCLAFTVWETVTDEFAKGILTLVLGRFLGYVDNIYNFEFGTTRASTKKDDTIAGLTQAAASNASTPTPTPTPAAPAVVLNTPSADVSTGGGSVTVNNDGKKD